MENVKITVVITAYNIAKQISVCLNELLNQTFREFDVVIVDDHSTDDTLTVAGAFSESFNGRLKMIGCEKNNGTPALTRNIALNSGLIDGEYVLFLDGDDNIEPDMLEKMYAHAVKEAADIVVCGYNRVNASNGKEYSREMVNFYVKDITPPENRQYIPWINGALWNKLIKRSCIGSEQVPVIRVGEDAAFMLRVCKNISKISFLGEILIHYNVADNSLMNTIPETEMYKLADEFKDLYETADDDEYKDLLILAAFIHIGLSMSVRAYQSKNIGTGAFLKRGKKYFKNSFGAKWYKTRFFRTKMLKNMGVKGYALKICVLLYRLGMFRIFLFAYDLLITRFGKDIKW